MFDQFDTNVILENLHFLIEGMQLTLLLTIAAICGGLVLGTLLALARLSGFWVLSLVSSTYVNFFRSMPLILVIFWFYFLVPLILGQPVGGYYSVLIAFVLFEASYYCEIIRAGIQCVCQGQVYAGQAVGLNYFQNMCYIVLPQAFRNMIPVLLTQAIILFQDTSLVYVVGVKDFLVSADLVANRENRIFEMFTTVACVYLIICLSGSILIRKLQMRYAL